MLQRKADFGFAYGHLLELGVTDDALVEIVLRGESLRDSATAYDPPTRGGYDAWAERVRALREALCPLEWLARDVNNCPIVVSPCGRLAIAVSSGDAATGIAGDTPRTRRALGPILLDQVETNQLKLFGNGKSGSGRQQPLTWILLTRRDQNQLIVRAEISLPSMVDKDDYVVGWSERHCLAPIDLSGPAAPTADDDAPAAASVHVRPR